MTPIPDQPVDQAAEAPNGPTRSSGALHQHFPGQEPDTCFD